MSPNCYSGANRIKWVPKVIAVLGQFDIYILTRRAQMNDINSLLSHCVITYIHLMSFAETLPKCRIWPWSYEEMLKQALEIITPLNTHRAERFSFVCVIMFTTLKMSAPQTWICFFEFEVSAELIPLISHCFHVHVIIYLYPKFVTS